MASQNSSSECFQGICRNYNEDFRKKGLLCFELCCNTNYKTFPWMCAPVTVVPWGQANPKCKAVDVTKQEAIMTQGDQADISLLGIFP